jgi:hypothetical protein
MSSTEAERGTGDKGTSNSEKGTSTSTHKQLPNLNRLLPAAAVRKNRVIVSGSQEKTNNALAFVMAGVLKLESEVWFAAQNGDEIVWYVERSGLEQMALNEGKSVDFYVQQVYQLVGQVVAAAQAAQALQGVSAGTPQVSIRLVWVNRPADLVDDINGLAAGSLRSISIFSHGTKNQIDLRYNPGHQGGWAITDQDVRGIHPGIFVPDNLTPFVYVGACRIGAEELLWGDVDAMAQRTANWLNVPVYAWTGRTSYTDVPAGQREGPSNVVWYARGGRYTGPRLDWAEIWRRASTPTFSDPVVKRFDPQ